MQPLDHEPVIAERRGAVLFARMNAPTVRNALSAEMKEGLHRVALAFSADAQLRCLVLTGTDAVFCAGGDLRDMAQQRSPQAVRERMALSHAVVQTLASCGKPVLTAINGAAVGAGLSLALLGDVVVASEDAFFMAGFSRVGVLPDLGLLYFLPRAIGLATAKDLLLTNRRLDAAQALRCGLISRVLPAQDFESEVERLATSLAEGPTVSLGLTKRMLDAAWREDLGGYLEREVLAQSAVFGSDDFLEGNRAFLEKRPPRFSGR